MVILVNLMSQKICIPSFIINKEYYDLQLVLYKNGAIGFQGWLYTVVATTYLQIDEDFGVLTINA